MAAPVTAADYKFFAEALATGDPIRLVAQVMLSMSGAQADLLRTLSSDITKLTGEMADVNDLINIFNAAREKEGFMMGVSKTDTSQVVVSANNSAASKDAMDDFLTRVIDAGGTTRTVAGGAEGLTVDQVNSDTALPWQVTGNKPGLATISESLRRSIDDLGAKAQQAQLTLQTLMGRFNGAFGVVTSTVKRSESQRLAVAGNIG